jgi:hypothetical protein
MTPAPPPALPSWHDSAPRAAILGFLSAVTDPDSPGYQPPAVRLAVFDHDGTLWCEKPLLVHLYAILDRYRQLARTEPRRLGRRMARALWTNDHSQFDDQGRWSGVLEPLGDLLGVPFAGMDDAAFDAWIDAWLLTWRHPRFDVPAAGLVYRPMRELIDLLHAHDFTVAISTADEAAFVRRLSAAFYGIPPDRVLGSDFGRRHADRDGRTLSLRGYHPDHYDMGAGKRLSVAGELGRAPLLIAGNSDGDIELLRWAAESPAPSLPLLLRHTDPGREYAYDRRAHAAQTAAAAEGWTIIDMAADWQAVFI